MVHHVVLFQFKPGATEAQIQDLADALVALKDKMPGVAKYVWGPSVSIERLEKGYTHGFILTFTDTASRDAYVPHPLHKELIKKYVDPICNTGLVFDIEE